MKHNLLSFLFFAILLALAYHFAFGLTYEHFFAASRAFQTYWYVPFIVVPALLQIGLGWSIGFWRPRSAGLGRCGRRGDCHRHRLSQSWMRLIPAAAGCF